LVDTLSRRLQAFPFGNGDLLAATEMADPFVAVEAQHDANRYLRRCGLQPVDVERLLDQSGVSSTADGSDGDGSDGEGSDKDEDADPPQTVAMLSLDMLSVKVATHDYSAAEVAVKEQVTRVLHVLSQYKLVLQMKPSIFVGRPGSDVLHNIAAFGHLGILLCSGVSLADMRTTGGERVRHALRRTCAEFCMQLGCVAKLTCVLAKDTSGAAAVMNDIVEFATMLMEQTVAL